jgi:hypothetical protein
MQCRRKTLWLSSDYRLRQLFEIADVMSEGEVQSEDDARGIYYGTTSVRLPTVSHGGAIPDEDAGLLAELLRSDPHARVRAIRIACREAQVRARSPLAQVRAEVLVHRDRQGIRFDVDVEARLLQERSRSEGSR